MFSFYRKHIAVFFALLFVVSQLTHVVHIVFEHEHGFCEHHAHNEVEHHKEEHETDSEFHKIFKEKTAFSETHDCAFCQQFQKTNLNFEKVFNIDIKNPNYHTYKPVLFNRLLSSSFLLDDVSLRGPPSIFL